MLAYIDSFAGLVPCKILGIERVNDDSGLYIDYIKVKVTARKNKAYAHGDVHDFTARTIVPRDCVIRKKDGTAIKPFSWKEKAPQFF